MTCVAVCVEKGKSVLLPFPFSSPHATDAGLLAIFLRSHEGVTGASHLLRGVASVLVSSCHCADAFYSFPPKGPLLVQTLDTKNWPGALALFGGNLDRLIRLVATSRRQDLPIESTDRARSVVFRWSRCARYITSCVVSWRSCGFARVAEVVRRADLPFRGLIASGRRTTGLAGFTVASASLHSCSDTSRVHSRPSVVPSCPVSLIPALSHSY